MPTLPHVKYLDVGPQSEIHRWKKNRGILKGSIVPLSLWRIDKSSGSIKLCNDQRPSIVYPITKVQGRGELSNGRFRNSKGFQVWQTQRAASYFRACLSARACTSSLSPSLSFSFLRTLKNRSLSYRLRLL